jgi:hypothetical protein
MVRSLAAAIALLAVFPARAGDPGVDAAQTYRIDTDATTRTVKPGAKGSLVIAIVPVATVHVDPRAPLKIALQATPGLALEKTSLGRKDAVDQQAQGPRFEVPFVAEKAGRHEAKAKLDFFVCSDQWCVKQARDVSVVIEAK